MEYLLCVLLFPAVADKVGAIAAGLVPKGTDLRTALRGFTVRRNDNTSEIVRPFPPNEVLEPLRLPKLAGAVVDKAGRHSRTLKPS